MAITEFPQGTPCWVDLGSSNLEASKSFYSQLFGWQPESSDDPAYGGYAVFHRGEDAVAGIGPLMSPDQPEAWTVYFACDDADATAAAVQANGGTVFAPPFDVGDQGRMAICSDPTGGVFGIWQKITFGGWQVINEPNSWCWNELRTTDAAAATRFYQAVFGMTSDVMDMGDATYTTLKVGDRTVCGVMDMDGLFPPGTPPHWAVFFTVADADEAALKVEKLGGLVQAPAMEAEGVGRWVPVADPRGASFLVMST
jgi:hypothetical protein